MSKPAIASLCIFTIVGTWNDFLAPLIYINSNEKLTVMLGLKTLIAEYGADYSSIMSAATLATIPIVVLFLIFQSYFVEGIATTGIKG